VIEVFALVSQLQGLLMDYLAVEVNINCGALTQIWDVLD